MTIQTTSSKRESILSIRYRKRSDSEYILWRSDWPTDRFDIILKEELDIIKQVMKMFGIPVIMEVVMK